MFSHTVQSLSFPENHLLERYAVSIISKPEPEDKQAFPLQNWLRGKISSVLAKLEYGQELNDIAEIAELEEKSKLYSLDFKGNQFVYLKNGDINSFVNLVRKHLSSGILYSPGKSLLGDYRVWISCSSKVDDPFQFRSQLKENISSIISQLLQSRELDNIKEIEKIKEINKELYSLSISDSSQVSCLANGNIEEFGKVMQREIDEERLAREKSGYHGLGSISESDSDIDSELDMEIEEKTSGNTYRF